MITSPLDASPAPEAAVLSIPIFVVYDEPALARKVVAAVRAVVDRWQGELEADFLLWRTDVVGDPRWSARVEQDLGEAQLLVVALQGPANAEAERWIRECLRRRTGQFVAVAAVASQASRAQNADLLATIRGVSDAQRIQYIDVTAETLPEVISA